jgi:hypothetical protein
MRILGVGEWILEGAGEIVRALSEYAKVQSSIDKEDRVNDDWMSCDMERRWALAIFSW